jgi:hypothetical protein
VAGGGGAGAAAAPGGSSGNTTIVYHRTKNSLQRAGVQSATPGAALTWVNAASAPQLAAAAQAAAAKAASAAEAKRQRAVARLRAKRDRAAAAAALQRSRRQKAAAAAVAGKAHARQLRPTKLVRIGGKLYSVTAQGLRCAEGAGSAAAAAANAAPSAHALATPRKLHPATPSAAPSAALGRTPGRGPALSAVARSLRNVRSRRLAQRAADRRGLCMEYCRRGECALARAGTCPRTHDPSKVAVCPAWLQGRCGDAAACKLQHKILPDLMPVCTFYLQVRASVCVCVGGCQSATTWV